MELDSLVSYYVNHWLEEMTYLVLDDFGHSF